ncbi:MAG: hypothetical protein LH630_04660, partial [Actinomycetia bacterium]|nr:hypothetical protein [Actinomycetes bacterium]
PLVVLSVPTAFFGASALNAAWLPSWIQPTATEPLSAFEALTPELGTVVLSAFAIAVGVTVTLAVRTREAVAAGSAGFVAGGFGVDVAYERLVVEPFHLLVRWVTAFDRSVIQRSVAEVGTGTQRASALLQRPYRGDVQRYVSTAVTAVIVGVVIMLVAVAT